MLKRLPSLQRKLTYLTCALVLSFLCYLLSSVHEEHLRRKTDLNPPGDAHKVIYEKGQLLSKLKEAAKDVKQTQVRLEKLNRISCFVMPQSHRRTFRPITLRFGSFPSNLLLTYTKRPSNLPNVFIYVSVRWQAYGYVTGALNVYHYMFYYNY